MRRLLGRLAIFIALVAPGLAISHDVSTRAEFKLPTIDQLRATFDAKTGLKSTAASLSPMPGLAEVIAGGQVFYMDFGGQFLFDGHVIDLATKRSVTAKRLEALNRVDLSRIDFSQAIRLVKGRPMPWQQVIVFEDPECGYCRKVHDTLAQLSDVTVYVMPIAALGDRSATINRTIWCSDNRALAWLQAIAGKPLNGDVACNVDGLRSIAAVADALQIKSTPTLIFADGTRVAGSLELNEIKRRMSESAPAGGSQK